METINTTPAQYQGYGYLDPAEWNKGAVAHILRGLDKLHQRMHHQERKCRRCMRLAREAREAGNEELAAIKDKAADIAYREALLLYDFLYQCGYGPSIPEGWKKE
jgi:hypothetical protein